MQDRSQTRSRPTSSELFLNTEPTLTYPTRSTYPLFGSHRVTTVLISLPCYAITEPRSSPSSNWCIDGSMMPVADVERGTAKSQYPFPLTLPASCCNEV